MIDSIKLDFAKKLGPSFKSKLFIFSLYSWNAWISKLEISNWSLEN